MTTEGRVPPNNLSAEESLLGAMLLSQEAIKVAMDLVGTNDFYQGTNGAVFDAILRTHRSGLKVDSVTVAEELGSSLQWVGGGGRLVQLQTSTPSTTGAASYARIIAEHSVRRRLIQLGDMVSDEAYNELDAEDIIEHLKDDLASIDLPSVGIPDGLISVDEFMCRGADAVSPWVVPGLMRVGWRQMIVAEEGAGKTLLAQQIGLAGSRGLHPFTNRPIEPFTTLFVDLENPEERLIDGYEMVTAGMRGPYPANQAWLWHRPGGINLRTRTDRAALEAVIQAVRPEKDPEARMLVCICPLYKAYTHSAKETDEQAAREVMEVFDDLRIRYNFALLLEHHAPKKQGGFRELQPYGSVLWMRWCEMGINLTRSPDQGEFENEKYILGRFRQDRVRSEWPVGMKKSTNGLPWEGIYDRGPVMPPPAQRGDIDEDPDLF